MSWLSHKVLTKDTFPKTGEKYFMDIYGFVVGSKHISSGSKSATDQQHITKIFSIDVYELSFVSLLESVFSPNMPC